MKDKKISYRATIPLIIILFIITISPIFGSPSNEKILAHIVTPTKSEVRFFLKDESGENYGNILNLKKHIESSGKKLLFSTNGGMFDSDHLPNGLYIENGSLIAKANNKKEGYGNFYLQPNGIFYLEKSGQTSIRKTVDFINTSNIKYATQSGPMLLIDGKVNNKLTKGSKNKNIRNGVGILPNGDILFAMSKEKINFYDFADFFKKHGCKEALYLDGYISKTYLPSENWLQTDGYLSVLIGVIE